MDFAFLQNATRWKRRGLAALFGLCAMLALPPLYLLPLLIPSFTGLFLLVHYAGSRRQAFLDGWWWGLGYFVPGLYWMCISLWVEPEKFAWLTPFALFGIQSVLAIYIGLTTLLLYAISNKATDISANPVAKIVLFSGLWVVSEYARAHLFTGFPWNLVGYVWTVSDITLQSAAIAGVYGLSWLAVILGTMPALFVLGQKSRSAVGLSVCLLVLMVIFGGWRLATHPTEYTKVRVRIVQANIVQSMTWDSKQALADLTKQMKLTQSAGENTIQLVVWPESAVPYYMKDNTPLTHDLGKILPPGALLLTGGVRGSEDPKRWQAWNSLFVINEKGRIIAQYDKHHLVPFGEFVPLRGLLPVENIVGGLGDFSRGSGPTTLDIPPYTPLSPLICYEAVFPDEATDGTHRARWLLNVTNDAWFGMSLGPYQHLQMARMRAVEQGIPLVRAGNTGISVFYDPLGRELGRIDLGKEGVLDNNLPQAEIKLGIVGRWPVFPVLVIFVLSGIFIFAARKTSLNNQ